jgi:hypothetical protein
MLTALLDTIRMGSVIPFTVVEGPEAWTAVDYADPSQYIYTFTASDLAELDAAVGAAAHLGKPIQVGSASHACLSNAVSDASACHHQEMLMLLTRCGHPVWLLFCCRMQYYHSALWVR